MYQFNLHSRSYSRDWLKKVLFTKGKGVYRRPGGAAYLTKGVRDCCNDL